MKDAWEITPTDITIKRGGKAPGCVAVGFSIIGLGIASIGVLIYFTIIDIKALNTSLPVAAFIVAFGMFWLIAGVRSRAGTAESTMVIDNFNRVVRFDVGGPVITTPFADIESIIVQETRTEQSTSTSVHARTSGSSTSKYSYTYRIYYQKKDGSIFWIWSFSRKSSALEHVSLLLERIEVSCIDRAGGTLERSLVNGYEFSGTRDDYSKTSSYTDVERQANGMTMITMRYSSRSFGKFAASVFLLGTFIGIPVWFFIANQPIVPGWFLIIPGVFLLFTLLAVFLRGRRYSVLCSPSSMNVSVRFWFPLFQAIFGKTTEVPASALKAVRINRYEDDEFHLELGIDGDFTLPRMSRASFNSGAVRMLPRDLVESGLNHIGLWSVLPANNGKGPSVNDLYAIEQLLQEKYSLDKGEA